MKNYILLLSIMFLAFACSNPDDKVKIIFDTDFGGDADDLGALAMLHSLENMGESELLAVMLWTTENYAVPAVDGLNRYYGHGDILIGARKDGSYHQEWNYNRVLSEAFFHELKQDDVPDAILLYRQILARSADHEIVLVTVGPLKNIMNLLQSQGDSISPLSGKDLLELKVKEMVIMGGNFPEGDDEWNFNGNMPGVTRYVLENLDVPICFSGAELGSKIKTGEVFNALDPLTPLYVGFMHFSEHSPWLKQHFKGAIYDNSSFDQSAVLYAVRGTGPYFEKSGQGICVADEYGGNTWESNPEGNHSYLKMLQSPEELAAEIESLMLGD